MCNRLPRKKLNYSTPEEMFKKELKILGAVAK
jgi:IS30 family transposase